MVEVGGETFLLEIGGEFLCALAVADIDDGRSWYLVENVHDLIGLFVGLAYYITEVRP